MKTLTMWQKLALTAKYDIITFEDFKEEITDTTQHMFYIIDGYITAEYDRDYSTNDYSQMLLSIVDDDIQGGVGIALQSIVIYTDNLTDKNIRLYYEELLYDLYSYLITCGQQETAEFKEFCTTNDIPIYEWDEALWHGYKGINGYDMTNDLIRDSKMNEQPIYQNDEWKYYFNKTSNFILAIPKEI